MLKRLLLKRTPERAFNFALYNNNIYCYFIINNVIVQCFIVYADSNVSDIKATVY
nr:MAG TPA: hypothetical protein [Caudoviricetes sp.]